ncbi:MAG: hypothetical protein OK457_00160 [Thaumarchaeota archaeon]|nr:hypothetical protein [Nitrososphaerota archaeon]
MKKKFSPILGDLSKLTPIEQEAYVLSACEFLQVPPELGVVGLQLMDTGDGARQLILYVKRGATDIIRDRRKICVDSLDEANGEGYIGWKVKGHDSTGRTEIAVGAVSIKGLTGRAIADAVAFAQTKAMRRMTLQFAGGGFLDELEINEKTTSIANSAQSLKEISQPIAAPNIQAGKDITDASKTIPASTPTTPPPPQPEPLDSAVGAISVTAAPAPEESKKRPRGRPKRVTLDSPMMGSEEASKIVKTFGATGPIETVIVPLISASTPESKSPEAAIKVTEREPTVTLPTSAPESAPEPKTLPFNGTHVTEEQKVDFRKRLAKYVNEILPAGGFLQSEKLGSRNDKMKLFVKAMFPTVDTKVLSLEQWTHFFSYMDEAVKNLGVESLVRTINTQIGEIQNEQSSDGALDTKQSNA